MTHTSRTHLQSTSPPPFMPRICLTCTSRPHDPHMYPPYLACTAMHRIWPTCAMRSAISSCSCRVWLACRDSLGRIMHSPDSRPAGSQGCSELWEGGHGKMGAGRGTGLLQPRLTLGRGSYSPPALLQPLLTLFLQQPEPISPLQCCYSPPPFASTPATAPSWALHYYLLLHPTPALPLSVGRCMQCLCRPTASTPPSWALMPSTTSCSRGLASSHIRSSSTELDTGAGYPDDTGAGYAEAGYPDGGAGPGPKRSRWPWGVGSWVCPPVRQSSRL